MMTLRAALLLFPGLAAAQQECAADTNGDGTVSVDGEHRMTQPIWQCAVLLG